MLALESGLQSTVSHDAFLEIGALAKVGFVANETG